MISWETTNMIKLENFKNKFSLETQRLKVIEMIILNKELERKNLIELFLQFVWKLDDIILKLIYLYQK